MTGRIDVVGLGPAGLDLTTSGTLAVIADAQRCFLRTARHPAAEQLLAGAGPAGLQQGAAGFETFDRLYESGPTFGAVYRSIVEELVAAAENHGRVAYVVPGSPTVAESTVEMLLGLAAGSTGPEVAVHPAMSFADLAWARMGVDPVAVGARLADGHDFAAAVGRGGPVLVAQCESRLTLSEIKLSIDEPPDTPVTLLQRLGLPDESILEVAWGDIDRSVEPDHLTSLWIPELPRSAGGRLDELARLMEALRAADPWKAAQDHDTLRRYLLEEAYEVLEALDGYHPDSGEGAEELASELGDLLYQVVFHSSLAAAAGWFDLADVVAAIHDKLVARHPHIDGTGTATAGAAPSIEELTAGWEQAKLAEHGRSSAFDGIPAALPALVRTMVIAKKASALGLGIDEPTDSPGGSLLAVALEAISAGVDPEDALRRELVRVEGILRAAGQ